MACSDLRVTLFDVPTKDPRRCSSPNTWKVRALLNYKDIPYRTTWLEYPEIEPTMKSLGVPENTVDITKGIYTKYWCPVVQLKDSSYLMESHNIALALEKLHPDPPAYVGSDRTQRAQSIIDAIQYALAPAFIHRLADDNFTPSTREWYHHHRGNLFGTTDLYEVAKMQPWSGETPWVNASDAFQNLAALLHEDDTGPFVRGSTPSYADFIIVGLWKSLRLMDRDGDVYGRVMGIDTAFPRIEEACNKWFKRDDY